MCPIERKSRGRIRERSSVFRRPKLVQLPFLLPLGKVAVNAAANSFPGNKVNKN